VAGAPLHAARRGLVRSGAEAEAHKALGHARWLRARAGETARALVTARLAEILFARAA